MLPLALHADQPLPAFEDRLRWICHSLSKALGRDAVLESFLPVVRAIVADDRMQSRSRKDGNTTMKPNQHVRANVTDDGLIVLDLVKDRSSPPMRSALASGEPCSSRANPGNDSYDAIASEWGGARKP